jgi:TonB family protein
VPILRGIAPRSGPPTLGGAIPDRRGGQVDLGPLSFDTEWYDWGPYAAEMLRRIRYHWRIPEIARLGVPGSARIRFTIERDGRVSGLEVQQESDHQPMTFAARDAILNASPLPPLPADLTGVEREGVTITFYYNMRPPDEY